MAGLHPQEVGHAAVDAGDPGGEGHPRALGVAAPGFVCRARLLRAACRGHRLAVRGRVELVGQLEVAPCAVELRLGLDHGAPRALAGCGQGVDVGTGLFGAQPLALQRERSVLLVQRGRSRPIGRPGGLHQGLAASRRLEAGAHPLQFGLRLSPQFQGLGHGCLGVVHPPLEGREVHTGILRLGRRRQRRGLACRALLRPQRRGAPLGRPLDAGPRERQDALCALGRRQGLAVRTLGLGPPAACLLDRGTRHGQPLASLEDALLGRADLLAERADLGLEGRDTRMAGGDAQRQRLPGELGMAGRDLRLVAKVLDPLAQLDEHVLEPRQVRPCRVETRLGLLATAR